jgi:hypothetical protein
MSEEFKEPSHARIMQLYFKVIEKNKIDLSEFQKVKLESACRKSIIDNPGSSLHDLAIAAGLHLKFILEFPEYTL